MKKNGWSKVIVKRFKIRPLLVVKISAENRKNEI